MLNDDRGTGSTGCGSRYFKAWNVLNQRFGIAKRYPEIPKLWNSAVNWNGAWSILIKRQASRMILTAALITWKMERVSGKIALQHKEI